MPETRPPCFNAVKHGCCAARLAAKSPVLPGEDEELWQNLLHEWFAEYQPDTPVSRALVIDLAAAFWQKARCCHRFQEFERSLAETQPGAWSEQDHLNYTRFQRYKTTADRTFSRAFKDLEYFRKTRTHEAEARRRAEERFEEVVRRFAGELLNMEMQHDHQNAQDQQQHRKMQAAGLLDPSAEFVPRSREDLDRLGHALKCLRDRTPFDYQEAFKDLETLHLRR